MVRPFASGFFVSRVSLPVFAKILDRIGKQFWVVTEKAEPGVAATAEKAALTIGFCGSDRGQGPYVLPTSICVVRAHRKCRSTELGFPTLI
jgi:hypothetical protein